MATTIQLIQQLQKRVSKYSIELVYTAHEKWPLVANKNATLRPLKVMVLDASFNPPTLAHLALLNAPRPPINGDFVDYDAKLLLLSVTNAMKVLKPGDATYPQRAEMMTLLAKHAASTTHFSNIAVAIIDEPMFAQKSPILHKFLLHRLQELAPSAQDLEVTFTIGYDTLERLFTPKYYDNSQEKMEASLRKLLSPKPQGDGARIVCANRVLPTSPPSLSSAEPINEYESPMMGLADEYIATERITIIDIGKEVENYSSTAVRTGILANGLDGDEWTKLVTPNIAQYIREQNLYSPR